MTDPIHDLDGLLSAFGVTSIHDLEGAIDEAADIEDGSWLTIDAQDVDEPMLIIGTRGIAITFPTDVTSVLQLAAEVEKELREQHVSIYPGHEWSSVIIHVPHASRLIPDDVRDQILLEDAELERELDAMTDAFTDFIAQRVADTTLHRPWIVVNELSRLVIDPERFPDDREEMNAVGMGAVYTRTSDGSPLRDEDALEADELIRTYFDPYATALTDLVDERLATVGSVLIIDLHSYPLVANPYELHTDGPRPEICIGTDPFHTPESLVEVIEHSLGGFDVGTDSPFGGCYVPLKHYGTRREVQAFMIELRRDLYVDESGALVELAVAPIAEALARLISMIDLEPLRTCRGMGNFMEDVHFDEQTK